MDKTSLLLSKDSGTITISDLRDDYFDNLPINSEQISALKQFDKYRIKILECIKSDAEFQKKYLELQIIENTVDYRDFLDSLNQED